MNRMDRILKSIEGNCKTLKDWREAYYFASSLLKMENERSESCLFAIQKVLNPQLASKVLREATIEETLRNLANEHQILPGDIVFLDKYQAAVVLDRGYPVEEYLPGKKDKSVYTKKEEIMEREGFYTVPKEVIERLADEIDIDFDLE